MVLTPLFYHAENVGSQSDGGNQWLLFTGPKEDTAANLKWRLFSLLKARVLKMTKVQKKIKNWPHLNNKTHRSASVRLPSPSPSVMLSRRIWKLSRRAVIFNSFPPRLQLGEGVRAIQRWGRFRWGASKLNRRRLNVKLIINVSLCVFMEKFYCFWHNVRPRVAVDGWK